MQYLICLLCLLYVTSYGQCQYVDTLQHVTVENNLDHYQDLEKKDNNNADISNCNVDQSNLEASIYYLYNAIGLTKYDLSYQVFRYGMIGYYTLQAQGKLSAKKLLSIIDFTKSSCKKRLYIIDLDRLNLKYYTYVSHGKNTGEDRAEKFSNIMHSNQSSIGFYLTAETYVGTKGYSLKLDGMEKGYNDKLRDRAVVMHEADYVSEKWIKQNGRLGRSQGCPALPVEISKEIIDTIKEYTPIFAYYNDNTYINNSEYLSLNHLLQMLSTSAKSSNPFNTRGTR